MMGGAQAQDGRQNVPMADASAVPAQGIPGIDVNALKQMDPQARTQAIGNAIYSVIQPHYGDHTGKIVGMLLDNERIVDPFMLVSNVQYLQTKANEAFSLLSSQPMAPAQAQ